MRMAVVGGSGLIGERQVDLLRAQGHDVIAASRATGVDAITGSGLNEALVGAEVVIDVTNTGPTEGQGPFEFFDRVSRNLAAAELAAGVRHHIALSIVGVENLESSYFRAKVAQERVVRTSGIPYPFFARRSSSNWSRGSCSQRSSRTRSACRP